MDLSDLGLKLHPYAPGNSEGAAYGPLHWAASLDR